VAPPTACRPGGSEPALALLIAALLLGLECKLSPHVTPIEAIHLSKKPHTLSKNRYKAPKRHLRVNDRKDVHLTHNPDRTPAMFAFEPSRTEEALQLLTRRLLHAQEDERRTVARELHDGLNQTLAMLGVEVGIAINQLPGSAKTVRQQLQRILLRVEQLTEEVREISHRLHPALLEHLGLVSALRSYCSEFEQYRHLDVLFACEGSADQIPFQVALCLYRIVQEALTNVVRHAAPTSCEITVTVEAGEVLIEVTDDGPRPHPGADDRARPRLPPHGAVTADAVQHGADNRPERGADDRARARTPAAGGRVGHGLIGMRERVLMYGGSFRAGPRPEGGFAVFARLPWEP